MCSDNPAQKPFNKMGLLLNWVKKSQCPPPPPLNQCYWVHNSKSFFPSQHWSQGGGGELREGAFSRKTWNVERFLGRIVWIPDLYSRFSLSPKNTHMVMSYINGKVMARTLIFLPLATKQTNLVYPSNHTKNRLFSPKNVHI